MSRDSKESLIQHMRTELETAQAVLFLDFTGITVAQADALRNKFRPANVHYRVVKNTLMLRALTGTPFEQAGACLKGTPTGVIWSAEDPVTPAKLTFESLKDLERLKIKGGIVDKKAISPQEAEALSKMPSKAEMQGEIVSLAQSPGRRLAGMFKHASGKIVGAIEALEKRLEEQG